MIRPALKLSFTSAVLATLFTGSALSGDALVATVELKNNSPYFQTYTVMSDGWNCNDFPLRGAQYKAEPNSSVTFQYMKTSGHGCDGEQGIFQLGLSIPTYEADPLPFSYSTDGSLTAFPSRNYAVERTVVSSTNYIVEITPAIQ